MKTTNLMINDYVQLKDGYYGMPKGTIMQVAEVFNESAYCQDINIVFEALEVPDYLLEPIPLTDKILEENGFEKQSDYQWEYRDNGCKIVISIAPQIKIEGELLVEPPINIMLEGALFDINITSDCYVHTLQQCFRLLKIEKEIVL